MTTPHDTRAADMVGRRTDGTLIQRPLSPHLQVYDMLQMSSFLSILHRITGTAWSAGTVLLVWWLVAAATGEEAFATVQWVMGSWFGLLVLFGLTAAAWYHTLAGVRHLLWNGGFGFELPMMYRTGWAVIFGTGGLTVLTWLAVFVFWG